MIAGGAENQDAEQGARLTCHILLRLLDESTDHMSHDHSSALKFPFPFPFSFSSPDHHLLAAAHETIGIGAVLAVFKAMLKLSEAGLFVLIYQALSFSPRSPRNEENVRPTLHRQIKLPYNRFSVLFSRQSK